jgi:multidrug efflux pump subunit AcrB
MKTLAGWPIRHPATAFSVLLLLLIVGLAFGPWLVPQRLAFAPDVGVRVEVELPGLDPALIESAVVDPLERSFATLTGVRRMLSRSSEGRAEIRLQFSSGTVRDAAIEDVRTRVKTTALPSGVQPPAVERDEPVLLPSAIYAISAPSLSGEIAQWAEHSLRRPLQELPETSTVIVEGAEQSEILVQPNVRRMATLGLSFDEVIRALRGRDEAPRRAGVRRPAMLGSATTEAVAARAVHLPGGESVALAEVAEISLSRVPASSQPRYRGEPALLLTVYPRSAKDASIAAERTSAHLAWLRANGTVPAAVQMQNLFDESSQTRQWRRQWLRRIGVCALTALAAVALFFGVRQGLAALALFVVSLPLAAAASWSLGLTFNTMTALGTMLACLPVTLLLASPLSWRRLMVLVFTVTAILTLLAAWSPALLQVGASFFITAAAGGLVGWLLTPWIAPRANVAALSGLLPLRWRPAAGLLAAVPVAVAIAIGAMAPITVPPPTIAAVADSVLVAHVWGPQPQQVADLARQYATTLRATPGVAQVSESTATSQQWRLQLDMPALEQFDITLAEVGRAFAVARGGLVIGDGLDGDKRLPLRLRVAPDVTGPAFERLLLRGEHRQQRAIYLRDVGLTLRVNAPLERLRMQQLPAAEIRARLSEPGTATKNFSVLSETIPPAGYSLDWRIGTPQRPR